MGLAIQDAVPGESALSGPEGRNSPSRGRKAPDPSHKENKPRRGDTWLVANLAVVINCPRAGQPNLGTLHFSLCRPSGAFDSCSYVHRCLTAPARVMPALRAYLCRTTSPQPLPTTLPELPPGNGKPPCRQCYGAGGPVGPLPSRKVQGASWASGRPPGPLTPFGWRITMRSSPMVRVISCH